MKHATIKIENNKGLHARASVKLAELCQTFNAEITLSNNSTVADAKNVMQLMMLAASNGSQLELKIQSVNSHTEEAAHQAIQALFSQRFDESE